MSEPRTDVVSWADRVAQAGGGGGVPHVHLDLAPLAHDHDGRYHTEAEADARYAAAGHAHAGTANPVQRAFLAADVASPATANALGNVTGLAFPVVAGRRYQFRAWVAYTVPATTTGSRWTIDCPAASLLVYQSEWSLTTTTTARNPLLTAKQQPAAASATSGATAGNVAAIEGLIHPTANGTVQVQFASEVAASPVTAKAGSLIEWQEA